MIELYADGSCLDNQTPEKSRGGIGFVAVEDGERAVERSEFAGDELSMSNNAAEYDAVLAGLRWRDEERPDEDVLIYTDSRLIVKQILGEWRCNAEHLESRMMEVRDRMTPGDEIVEAGDNRHLARAHDLAQAGAHQADPPESSPSSKPRSSSGSGGVTEINIEPLDEVPDPVEQPHEWLVTENIPDELKRRPQWINWAYSERNGKQTKIPWQGWESTTASTNDPETFTDFETAVDYVFTRLPPWVSDEHDYIPSVGFVLTTGDPYCVLDLDDCRDEDTGEVDQWAKYVVHNLGSYCQISPSATGLHVFIKDTDVPDEWKNKKEHEKEWEVYSEGRYITMTGRMYDDGLDKIESRPGFDEWLLDVEEKLYG